MMCKCAPVTQMMEYFCSENLFILSKRYHVTIFHHYLFWSILNQPSLKQSDGVAAGSGQAMTAPSVLCQACEKSKYKKNRERGSQRLTSHNSSFPTALSLMMVPEQPPTDSPFWNNKKKLSKKRNESDFSFSPQLLSWVNWHVFKHPEVSLEEQTVARALADARMKGAWCWRAGACSQAEGPGPRAGLRAQGCGEARGAGAGT